MKFMTAKNTVNFFNSPLRPRSSFGASDRGLGGASL